MSAANRASEPYISRGHEPSYTVTQINSLIRQALKAERERICNAIKAEDDYCVDNGDYMLDSNDCIQIVRKKWKRPIFEIEQPILKKGLK